MNEDDFGGNALPSFLSKRMTASRENKVSLLKNGCLQGPYLNEELPQGFFQESFEKERGI